MQAVKDSFYMALRGRLAAGNSREIVVCENGSPTSLSKPDTFYLRWSGADTLPPDAAAAGWRSLRCAIAYRTSGSEDSCGDDRGRELATMDAQLSAAVEPRQTALLDYTQEPPADLANEILWTAPVLLEPKDSSAGIEREVQTTLLWREEAE